VEIQLCLVEFLGKSRASIIVGLIFEIVCIT
jgi:hypothetical protein